MDRPSTASVRSSVYETVQENGRTYHRYKEGSKLFAQAVSCNTGPVLVLTPDPEYMLPNDDVSAAALCALHRKGP